MYNQLYHCGIEKAATTFFRQIFKAVFKNGEYRLVHYGTELKKVVGECYLLEGQTEVKFSFDKVVTTNISCDYATFCRANEGHGHYRGFYMYRDPRELVMSSYWSWKLSHGGGHPASNILLSLSIEDGIDWCTNDLCRLGAFEAMASWVEQCHDHKMRLYKFEDFFASAESQNEHLDELFDFLHLTRLPENMKVYFAWKNLSGGRDRLEEDNTNHYRAGGITWPSHMTDKNLDHFYNKTGNTTEILGYTK